MGIYSKIKIWDIFNIHQLEDHDWEVDKKEVKCLRTINELDFGIICLMIYVAKKA